MQNESLRESEFLHHQLYGNCISDGEINSGFFFRDIRAKLKVIVDETRAEYPEFNPCLAIVQVK